MQLMTEKENIKAFPRLQYKITKYTFELQEACTGQYLLSI